MAFLLPLLGEAGATAGAAEGAGVAAGASEAGAAEAGGGASKALNASQFAGKGGGGGDPVSNITDQVKNPLKGVESSLSSLSDPTNSISQVDLGGLSSRVGALSHQQFGG